MKWNIFKVKIILKHIYRIRMINFIPSSSHHHLIIIVVVILIFSFSFSLSLNGLSVFPVYYFIFFSIFIFLPLCFHLTRMWWWWWWLWMSNGWNHDLRKTEAFIKMKNLFDHYHRERALWVYVWVLKWITVWRFNCWYCISVWVLVYSLVFILWWFFFFDCKSDLNVFKVSF